MADILRIMIGLMLLGLGYRVFWLFVASVGFVVGLQMAQLYFGLQPLWVMWASALLFGLVGVCGLTNMFGRLSRGGGGWVCVWKTRKLKRLRYYCMRL